MSAPTADRKAWSVLIVSTLAFTVCFMVWMMFGVIGIPIKKQLASTPPNSACSRPCRC
jgi:NNP family nitrate/nitrite transporter-like MFS transporter